MNELNYVLTRILDMDHRAAQVKKEAQKRLEHMEAETKEILATTETELAQETERQLDVYWKEVVQKAEVQSNQIRESAVHQSKAMKETYEKNKDSLVKDGFQRMMAGS